MLEHRVKSEIKLGWTRLKSWPDASSKSIIAATINHCDDRPATSQVFVRNTNDSLSRMLPLSSSNGHISFQVPPVFCISCRSRWHPNFSESGYRGLSCA
eukprot:1677481-Rhodomonas_salina.2